METKIQLSEEESNLVTDASILLTKNRVMAKMQELLGGLSEVSRETFSAQSVLLPASAIWPAPKISKGENYGGLPYLMLDYPRLFSNTDVFALRTMFWWGHYFSVTLHLKGIYLQRFLPDVRKQAGVMASNNYMVSTGADEWKHELQAPFYRAISADGNDPLIQTTDKGGFLKLGAIVPLLPLEQAMIDMARHYRLLAMILGFNSPGDETGL